MILAGALILGSVSKIMAYGKFQFIVWVAVPEELLSHMVAGVVIASELLIAMLILFPRSRGWAAAAAAGMLVAYSAIASVLKALGRMYECACFGLLLPSSIDLSFYLRNGVLLVCALTIALLARRASMNSEDVRISLLRRVRPALLGIDALLVGWWFALYVR